MSHRRQLRQKLTSAAVCLFGLLVVTWLDYALGEISVGPFYFLIVAYTGWQFNTLAAGAVVSVIATAGRLWAESLSGPKYSSDWILYENACMWLLVFLATAYALTSYRRTLDVHRSRLETLRKMVPICQDCGSVRGPDGRWTPFSQLSRSPFPEVTECPDCAAKQESSRV